MQPVLRPHEHHNTTPCSTQVHDCVTLCTCPTAHYANTVPALQQCRQTMSIRYDRRVQSFVRTRWLDSLFNNHKRPTFTEPHSWLQYCCGSVTPPAVRDDAQAHPTRGWSQIGQGCFSSNRHLQLGASGQQVHDPLLPQAGLEVVLLHLIKHACQQVLLGAQPLFVSLRVQAKHVCFGLLLENRMCIPQQQC